MTVRRVLLAWSSGKDGAWTLHHLRRQALLRNPTEVEVVGLLTTVDQADGRVAMHATRRELVEAQAEAAGLPLSPVSLPWPCPNVEYERRMTAALERAREEEGVTHVAFGDLYLEEIRDYRIGLLKGTGIEPLFPLWCSPAETPALARRMIDGGLSAVVTCVDPERLGESYLGRRFDQALLADLPPEVDPCAERGEFHTVCFGGPMFDREIEVEVGERFTCDRFAFADLRLRRAVDESAPLAAAPEEGYDSGQHGRSEPREGTG